MKTKEEIKQWILDNCIDEDGDVDLRKLDFSDFDGDVGLSQMKVKKSLYQDHQEVGEELYQDEQKVNGDLYQNRQKVGGGLIQAYQKVDGNLRQDHQKVNGDLYQCDQEVKGSLFQNRQTVGGELVQDKQQKTKKVFSTALWVKDALSAGLRNEKRSGFSWANDCAGKTKEECKAMGYMVIDAWFEEVEVKE